MSYESDLVQTHRALQKQNHPRKGASIKVEPIREVSDLLAVTAVLKHHPRNLCLFILGINTGYRASELLSLCIADVSHVKVGDSLEIKQLKNKKYRRATVNNITYDVLQNWLACHPNPNPHARLFVSQRGSVISVSYVCQLMKKWCAEAGLHGNFGSHTLRKTWGYHQRTMRKADVCLLMRAYGHASEAQTLAYLGIQSQEIRNLYLDLELPIKQTYGNRKNTSNSLLTKGAVQMTTQPHDLEDLDDEEDNPSIAIQLLQFQDDLNAMLSEQDFYRESIDTLVRREDGDILHTDRQKLGLTHIGGKIIETGNALSERLETIRKQVGVIGRTLS